VEEQTPKSTIELNGNRYDAKTGKLVHAQHAGHKSQIMDIKKPQAHHLAKPSKSVHRKMQPSHTLMRKAVKKPSLITIYKTVAMDVVSPAVLKTASAEAFYGVSSQRVKRAESVRQNSLITRFADFNAKKPHTAVLSDTIAPATVPVHEPIIVAIPPATAHPANQAVKHSKTNKMLEKGLRSAESHNEKPAKKPKLHHRLGKRMGLSAKAASIAASTTAVLAFGVFFGYQNIPNINVRYAGAKSGVRAGLPSYQPAGFAVSNHVKYGTGSLTISYRANADDRSYDITQQNTGWDSAALKDHLTTTSGMTPQIYPDNGRTIYLHGTSSADWVAGGVWYTISDNANLNTDQLIKIATSI